MKHNEISIICHLQSINSLIQHIFLAYIFAIKINQEIITII